MTFKDDTRVDKKATRSIIPQLTQFHDILYNQLRNNIGGPKSCYMEKIKVLSMENEAGCYIAKVKIEKEFGEDKELTMKYILTSPNFVEVLNLYNTYTDEYKFRNDLDMITQLIQNI